MSRIMTRSCWYLWDSKWDLNDSDWILFGSIE